MACGCKNKQNGASSKGVVKTSTTVNRQESTPSKPVSGTKIIKREIR